MTQDLNHLLYHVPTNATYACDSTELNAEDIEPGRADALLAYVRPGIERADNIYNHFTAARILTNWGYDEGLDQLKEYILRPETMNDHCYMQHRLWGYNDSYHHILMAVTMYHARKCESGNENDSREKIKQTIKNIIFLSNENKFDISNLYGILEYHKYDDYNDEIRGHLSAIIDHLNIHRWKVYDALVFVEKFDAEFVKSLLKARGKEINDYKLNPNWSPVGEVPPSESSIFRRIVRTFIKA
jgi:hypothetical protein